MSKSLNRFEVIGNLGKDPEMRYTPSGHAVTQFNVAASDSYTNAAGEKVEKTEWFTIVAWRKLAEICNQYLNKGQKVYISGKIQNEKYTDKDGVERYTYKVVADDMLMLSGGNGAREGTGEMGNTVDEPGEGEEVRF